MGHELSRALLEMGLSISRVGSIVKFFINISIDI